MTFAIITGRAAPDDVRPETWQVVAGFESEDEALVYAGMQRKGEVVPNSFDRLKKKGPLVVEITEYEQALSDEGRLEQYQGRVARRDQDKKEAEKAEVERQRKLKATREESKRRKAVELRQQEIMDARLHQELETARQQAEAEISEATA